ncbi:hypothetical protein [Pseudorhodobacter ferrugineus]|uniref:hypothetical protein n=1 Tax=Pseudorhodobacter ferrugineus TaxID=77008 RepID=UPI0003B64B14|nr:hypothetical protein [Pseudorhodobacter ferrugineus]
MTVTSAELAAAMPHVRAAPKTDTTIHSLCLRPARNERSFPETLHLTRAHGITGDRWQTDPWLRLPNGDPDPNIQVSILPLRVLNLIWTNRQTTPHPGDTFIADLDTSLENLPDGTRLQAGTAILRVSNLFNEGCVKWKARYGADAKNWITNHPTLRLRGVLCAVEQDGTLRPGDPLRKL